MVLQSQGLIPSLTERLTRSLNENAIETLGKIAIEQNDLETTARLFADLPSGVSAIVGIGRGKALDVAKYVAFLGRVAVLCCPNVIIERRLLQPAIEPYHPRQAKVTRRGVAVRRGGGYRCLSRRAASLNTLGCWAISSPNSPLSEIGSWRFTKLANPSMISRHCCRMVRSIRISATHNSISKGSNSWRRR